LKLAHLNLASRALTILALIVSLSACSSSEKPAPTEHEAQNDTPSSQVDAEKREEPLAEVVAEPEVVVDPPAPWISPDAKDLSAELAALVESNKIPALACCLLKDGEIIAQGAAGTQRIDNDLAVSTESRWHLGSCTKAITATLAARLIEQGVLSWETTIAEVFPDLGENLREAYREKTLVELCSHHAQLPANGFYMGYKRMRTPEQSMADRARLVPTILAMEPAVEEGEFLYSNAGFIVAGSMLEKLTGKPWETLLREEVFAPLGMTSAGFGAPQGEQPWGHSGSPEDGLKPRDPAKGADNVSALGPAGTVHASLADWARFINLHLLGARGEEQDYLSAESFAKLHQVVGEGDYALGWARASRGWAGDTPVLMHNGSNTMWFAVVWAAPDKNMALIAACNAAGKAGSSATDQACGVMLRTQ